MSIQERARIRGVLAVPARVTLLDRLRASPQPLDAQALATATGLHMTTVRSHLDVLIEAGLVTTGRQQPPGRGRPRTLYAPSSAEARRRVTGLFAEMGFDPEPAVGGRILLHDCPFRDTARAHPEVVCAAHQGLLTELLARLDPTRTVPILEPFAQPGVCVITFNDAPLTRTQPESETS